MKLKCNELLSSFAFNFKLRHYTLEALCYGNNYDDLRESICGNATCATVGRCRLIGSKPELKARLVSAISA